jgi:hypothetical protein
MVDEGELYALAVGRGGAELRQAARWCAQGEV